MIDRFRVSRCRLDNRRTGRRRKCISHDHRILHADSAIAVEIAFDRRSVGLAEARTKKAMWPTSILPSAFKSPPAPLTLATCDPAESE
jgi:hypothetical protein